MYIFFNYGLETMPIISLEYFVLLHCNTNTSLKKLVSKNPN